jgi:hypothetical protein
MKKGNVLQYAFIITGIVIGYDAFQTFTTALWSFFNWIGDGGAGDSPFFPRVSDLIFMSLQSVACWWLIMRSDKLSLYVSEKTNTSNSFSIMVSPVVLLRILLVTMGIYFLLVNIPRLLNDIAEGFKASGDFITEGRYYVKSVRFISIVQMVLSITLIACADMLARFFAKKIADEPITLEQKIDEIEVLNNN